MFRSLNSGRQTYRSQLKLTHNTSTNLTVHIGNGYWLVHGSTLTHQYFLYLLFVQLQYLCYKLIPTFIFNAKFNFPRNLIGS